MSEPSIIVPESEKPKSSLTPILMFELDKESMQYRVKLNSNDPMVLCFMVKMIESAVDNHLYLMQQQAASKQVKIADSVPQDVLDRIRGK